MKGVDGGVYHEFIAIKPGRKNSPLFFVKAVWLPRSAPSHVDMSVTVGILISCYYVLPWWKAVKTKRQGIRSNQIRQKTQTSKNLSSFELLLTGVHSKIDRLPGQIAGHSATYSEEFLRVFLLGKREEIKQHNGNKYWYYIFHGNMTTRLKPKIYALS